MNKELAVLKLLAISVAIACGCAQSDELPRAATHPFASPRPLDLSTQVQSLLSQGEANFFAANHSTDADYLLLPHESDLGCAGEAARFFGAVASADHTLQRVTRLRPGEPVHVPSGKSFVLALSFPPAPDRCPQTAVKFWVDRVAYGTAALPSTPPAVPSPSPVSRPILTPSPTTCANPQSAAGFRIIAREHALADCKETLVWKAPFSCEELSARKDGATLKIKIGERSVVWFYGADIDIVAPLATGQLTIGISDDSTAACPGVQHVLAADTDLVMFTGDPRDEGRPAQYLSPSGPWVEAEYAYGSQQPFWRARITSPVTTLRVYNRRSKRFVTPALSPDLEGWFNVTDREDLRRLIPEQRHLEFVTETAESKLVMAFGDTFASSQSPNDIRDLTNPGRNRTAIVATDLEF